MTIQCINCSWLVERLFIESPKFSPDFSQGTTEIGRMRTITLDIRFAVFNDCDIHRKLIYLCNVYVLDDYNAWIGKAENINGGNDLNALN